MMNETIQSLKLKELYRSLAEMLTTQHDFLRVEANQQANFIALAPRAHKDDVGKLIGDGGETFHAMRVICSQAAFRLGVKFHLSKIKEDARTAKRSGAVEAPVRRADWPSDAILRVARSTCGAVFGLSAQVEWNHQGGDKSVLELGVAPGCELSCPEEVLAEALDRVFKAIGNAQGRALRLELSTNARGTAA